MAIDSLAQVKNSWCGLRDAYQCRFLANRAVGGVHRQDMYDLGGMTITLMAKHKGAFPMNTSPPDHATEATSGEWTTMIDSSWVAPPQIQYTENYSCSVRDVQ
jgi:hypothetical protein